MGLVTTDVTFAEPCERRASVNVVSAWKYMDIFHFLFPILAVQKVEKIIFVLSSNLSAFRRHLRLPLLPRPVARLYLGRHFPAALDVYLTFDVVAACPWAWSPIKLTTPEALQPELELTLSSLNLCFLSPFPFFCCIFHPLLLSWHRAPPRLLANSDSDFCTFHLFCAARNTLSRHFEAVFSRNAGCALFLQQSCTPCRKNMSNTFTKFGWPVFHQSQCLVEFQQSEYFWIASFLNL